MICTEFDGYMKQLCHEQLMISWVITLTDGVVVYGDYERPQFENPWIRLREHCEKHDVLPSKVELYMFGAEHKVFFEDENGLDGLFIMRGVAKDQAMDGSHSQSFQTLTVGLLRDDCEHIESVRGLSTKNLEQMIFKNGSQKREHKAVQEYLNRAAV